MASACVTNENVNNLKKALTEHNIIYYYII